MIVGSLPTKDGLADTAQAGCLLVLDSTGKVAETITDTQTNGPWEMTVWDGTGGEEEFGDEGHYGSDAALFVTNVLNETVAGGGKIVHDRTVIRVALSVSTEVGPERQIDYRDRFRIFRAYRSGSFGDWSDRRSV